MTPHMEMDSSKNVKIHINPKHLIASTVHINPKIIKNHSIHINPKSLRVHLNPKLINNFSFNNINTSLSQSMQNSTSIQEIPSDNLQPQKTFEEKEKILNKNKFNQDILIKENHSHLTRNQQAILPCKNVRDSEVKIKMRDKIQKFSPLSSENLEKNPLISLSKTKLVRKENIKLKKCHKIVNDSPLPLVSISKTKLVRKQVTNLRRLSSSKKSLKISNQMSPNLISLSKTKLIRKNILKSSEHQTPRNSGTKLIKSKKIINKQTNITHQSLIALSRNKLVRKSPIANKKIRNSKKTHTPRKLITSPTSIKSVSKYKLIQNCKKESKSSSNHFKLDNRKVPRTSNQQISREPRAKSLPENRNITILKARAVVRKARKRAIYPKTEGLVWMRKGAKLLPVCKYFLAGCCNKDLCPYLHVKHSIKAPVCMAFLKGQCAQGEKCIRRHVLICPRWDRFGTCHHGKKCRWSHGQPRSTKKIKQEKDLKRQVQGSSKPKEFSEEMEEKNGDNNRKRYYERESERNEVQENIPDDSISDNLESSREEEEDAPDFLANRPKIGHLPSFIPLS